MEETDTTEFHIVELYKLTPEIIQWCTNSFGKTGHRWWMNNYRIYFRNQHDHLMFLLKWYKNNEY